MLQQFNALCSKFTNLPLRTREAALNSYIARREKILENLDNMTVEGTFKLGITLQKKGRETIDLDIAQGYAIWFTGLWLESMHRPGDDATTVHEIMNELAKGPPDSGF